MAEQGVSNGEIITFYSYKGGVGRTFALANIAALLVHWGFKVLCVDWDIEAPGIHFYFPENVVEKGLYELVSNFKARQNFEDWRDYIHSVKIPRSGKQIDIIYAASDDHEGVVNPLDWEAFYTDERFGSAIETLRDEWKKAYDFIFIDSRTGVTDGSAICTVQLPDTLAFLLTANEQSLRGSLGVVEKAIRARQGLPVERSGLRTIPVVSRFDASVEYDLASEWKEKLSQALFPFYASWVSNNEVARAVLEKTTIPYIARWSFGESIVGRQEYDAPSFITYYFTNLAAIFANRFNGVDTFVAYRESFVTSAQTKKSDPFYFDAFISAPREFIEISMRISRLLQAGEFKIFNPHMEKLVKGRDVVELINDGLSRSRNLVFFSGSIMLEGQLVEVQNFLRQSVATNFSRRIIPVSMTRGGIQNAPELIRSFRAVPAYDENDQIIAGSIAAEIASQR